MCDFSEVAEAGQTKDSVNIVAACLGQLETFARREVIDCRVCQVRVRAGEYETETER